MATVCGCALSRQPPQPVDYPRAASTDDRSGIAVEFASVQDEIAFAGKAKDAARFV